jgi:hypothetical protein
MVAIVDRPSATSSDANVRTSSRLEPVAGDERRVLLVSIIPFALLVAGLSLAALMRESEPRPPAAGRPAGTSNHLQAVAEPNAHRPESSRGARNFTGIGF